MIAHRIARSNSRASLGLTRKVRSYSVPRLRWLARLEPAVALPPGVERPRTRGDCVDGPRPCPWASCRHHLLLEVLGTGTLRLVHGTDDVAAIPETCSLDVADGGDHTLDEIAVATNVTRERVRQVEESALGHVRVRRHLEVLR